MSGDVQPRKRKDKKRKKDELGVEEPRGTSAALGEGDVFMHSQHDHGTGGHWCAKIIFFSLLAVLITLVGLIILENRGLSELEANSVETRYSGVLEGWLEDAPDDDHHDVHTLELNHHDDEDDHDNDDEIDHGDEDEHDDDDEDELAEEHESDEVGHDEDRHDDEDDDEEQDDERDVEPTDEDEDETPRYRKYFGDDDEDETENDGDDEHEGDDEELNYENDDEQNDEDDDETQNDEDDDETQNHYERDTAENDDDDDEQSIEKFEVDDDDNDEENDDAQDDEDDEEHGDDHEEDDAEIEVERIEKEASEEEEPISLELPALPEDDDDDDDNDKEHDKDDDDDEDNTAEDEADDDDKDDDDDFLEADDDLPVVERITAPAGKPFVEVEEASSERPPDTLEEEEEYEKQQEELRKEEEQASHMWLKLAVGGALLVATHAVMRRATGPRDTPEREERVAREETPIDRRMTLIPEESTESVTPKMSHESSFDEEVTKKVYAAKSTPVKQPSEEEEDQDDIEVIEEEREEQKEQDKELYSDEEEVEDEEEEIVEEKIEVPKQIAPAAKKPDPVPEPEEKEDDVPDDVEIIDEEHLEEELDEEDEDEEEISDVDDVELLSRLEAKYGRLPEPERPGQRHKDGGNSIEDEWPGEPSDPYWRQQLDSIERELRQGAWLAAAERASAPELAGSARARLLAATALDRAAEAQRDNRLLSRAIAAYLHLLKMNERIPDKKLVEVCNRTLNRMQFRGNYLNAEPVYRLLIRRFPNDPTHRNNLSVSFLMANRADLAEEVLKETLMRWPNDRVALAHYAFVLKTQHNRLEEAVESFQKALSGDEGPACEPRFYYHLGDALLLLGRHTEAHEVHKRGAKLGHFLSSAQRSLYNVPRLKSRPWWNVEETPYVKLARALENSWKEILKEGEAARASYEKEKEGLKERGEWSQLDLFARGREIPDRCARAPVTCAVVRSEAAAVGCRRGQVKFSAMEPGTHVRAHVGPTNCRLRMHLALANTEGTFLRVDQETRQWREGRVLMFDDSFEHEVWHNGTRRRLVLIVDVWHPDLTDTERRTLTAI